ncbi:nucleoside monophosphate kinase [Candidatus Saccharibacteria bacterium]|nr:nucleoside monophosphate kinase [Candidatus Saccharibacteria bacterium]
MYSLTGGPGSGKTTQIELLGRHGYATVSAGVLLRERAPQRILDQMLKGDLADHDFTNSLIGQALDEFKASHGNDKIVLDGYPRALIQVRWLMEAYEAEMTACLLLTASDECVIRRLVERGRSDDQPEAVKQRLKVYRRHISEVLDYYAARNVPVYEIDAERPVEEIFKSVKEILQF